MNEAAMKGLKEYHEKLRTGEIEKPARKNPIEKAKEDPTSRSKAISAKCYDCIYDPEDSGSWRTQVAECSCVDCPLYPVRPCK